MQLIARHELWCYACSQLTDLIAQPVTAHSDWKLHTYTTRNGAHERNLFWKTRERCGLSSANQSPSTASHTSCHVFFILCQSSLTSLYHTLSTRTGLIIHSTLCLVTSDMMIILLINKVKVPSIQFEINMPLSAWVRVLLAEHRTKMANTQNKCQITIFLIFLIATAKHPVSWLSFLGMNSLIKCDGKHGSGAEMQFSLQ